jgi:hypothetical protein
MEESRPARIFEIATLVLCWSALLRLLVISMMELMLLSFVFSKMAWQRWLARVVRVCWTRVAAWVEFSMMEKAWGQMKLEGHR